MLLGARKLQQFYNGEQIPLPCFESSELLDERGGEFAWVAAAVEVARFVLKVFENKYNCDKEHNIFCLGVYLV